MVTIKDVAKAAGVSPSTVSRVVKDHPGISSDTKRKIRKIMQEMGYTPNVAARNLVTNKSYTIGLIVKSAVHEAVLNPFFTEVNFGVSEACRNEGFSTLMTAAQDDDSLFLEIKDLINSRRVDGFILLYSKEDDPVTNYLTSIGFPFVVIGKDISNIQDAIYVDNDNVYAAHLITDHLLDLGYRNITMITDNDVFAVAKDRIKGFTRALEKRGIEVEGRVVNCSSNEVSIRKTLEELLEKESVDAILTLDGVINALVLSCLYCMKVRIPEDVATATFNDSPMTELAAPPQTTVDIHPQELGREAGREIINLVRNPQRLKRNITVPVSIIERRSTQKEEGG
ncbi:LacI family DNA-binding transcriptional regulator [Salinicoccus sp. RF5]|uniref:LacI family DNA-binding transcriptional regulator n=1 Tax=Salinicoccus sp. RF5 TaxID=2748874 RepID=UPI001E4FD32E|nr:LacI family DNA-binding transcriptional regulator [Salinicoccus sp. RF5]MCC4723702.1 LacI family transcriptional regulator [Salinicoccus sp. RF5]